MKNGFSLGQGNLKSVIKTFDLASTGMKGSKWAAVPHWFSPIRKLLVTNGLCSLLAGFFCYVPICMIINLYKPSDWKQWDS